MQQNLAVQGLQLKALALLIECEALSYAVLRCWHLGLTVGSECCLYSSSGKYRLHLISVVSI